MILKSKIRFEGFKYNTDYRPFKQKLNIGDIIEISTNLTDSRSINNGNSSLRITFSFIDTKTGEAYFTNTVYQRVFISFIEKINFTEL